MRKLENAGASHNCKFYRVSVYCTYAKKNNSENPYKSYHVYKVIVVLHIHNKILGIRLEGHPANKNKSLILIKF